MGEEGNTYKLAITFEIDVPNTPESSNINTLVLLLQRLRDIENFEFEDTSIKIKETNSTITDIENILKCMRYREE